MKKQTNKIKENQRKTSLTVKSQRARSNGDAISEKKNAMEFSIFLFLMIYSLSMSPLDVALRHYELLFLLFKLMMNFRKNTVQLTNTLKLMIY